MWQDDLSRGLETYRLKFLARDDAVAFQEEIRDRIDTAVRRFLVSIRPFATAASHSWENHQVTVNAKVNGWEWSVILSFRADETKCRFFLQHWNAYREIEGDKAEVAIADLAKLEEVVCRMLTTRLLARLDSRFN